MKVRIKHAVVVQLHAQPGDELVVSRLTPELDALLQSSRVGGDRLAELVDEGGSDEKAIAPTTGETATTGGGRRGASRTATVSG